MSQTSLDLHDPRVVALEGVRVGVPMGSAQLLERVGPELAVEVSVQQQRLLEAHGSRSDRSRSAARRSSGSRLSTASATIS